MRETLGHPFVLVIAAALLAILGTEVGRRMAKRDHERDEVRNIVRRVDEFMLPHFVAEPGREEETLPARVARVEVLAEEATLRGAHAVEIGEANGRAVERVGDELLSHTREEERLFREERATRTRRQDEQDRRFDEFSTKLDGAVASLSGGNPEVRREGRA